MKPAKTSIKNKLDKIVSLIVRSKGKCERCGKTEGLQAAHIFSRGNMAVRYDFKNLLCLCSGCHIFFAHKNPIEFSEWVRGRLGEGQYQVLRRRATVIKQWTLKELQDLLTNLQILYGRYL